MKVGGPPKVGQAPREWVAAKKRAPFREGGLELGVEEPPSSVYLGGQGRPAVWVHLYVQSVSPLSTHVSCSMLFSRKTSVTWMRHHDEKSENLLVGWGKRTGSPQGLMGVETGRRSPKLSGHADLIWKAQLEWVGRPALD